MMRITMTAGPAALALLLGGVAAAQTAPARTVEEHVISLADAFPEVAAAKSRDFRARKIELAPGARTELISHAGRPAITYVIQGMVTEHRTGVEPIVHGARAATMDRGDISHYWENHGDAPALLLMVEVAPTQAG